MTSDERPRDDNPGSESPGNDRPGAADRLSDRRDAAGDDERRTTPYEPADPSRPASGKGVTSSGAAGLGDTDASGGMGSAYGTTVESARHRTPGGPRIPERRRPGTDEMIGGPETEPPEVPEGSTD